MNSIAEYLDQLNSLTQQNFEILKTINDSFFTKKEHLVVNVSGNRYVIPSFISLENKINALQESIENIVNAPKSGEAYFNYDGNSKTIQIRGFNNTPNSLSLDLKNTEKFYVKENSIFKDFITPDAYLKFDLTSLPDDISQVIIKKIVPISSEAKNLFDTLLGTNNSINIEYSNLYKNLDILVRNSDYEEYDTVKQLPIRKSIGTGTYVITKIIKDEILSDLTEQLTLEFDSHTPLTYKRFDGTIDVDLQIGQYLTTYDDRVKLQIVDINSTSNQLILNIVNGDYLDIVPYTDNTNENGFNIYAINDLHKLKFFSDNNYSADKYINVTLEEDQHIAIFIAPLNNRMNTQGPWGEGVLVDTYKIKYDQDTNKSYQMYYKENVRNIGDILKEIVTMINSNISKYSKEEFDSFTQYIPILDENNLSVVQINKHLNDSPTIQQIRSLYSQKKQYEIDLKEIQKKISDINSTLSTVSFDDTTNVRTIYESQLTEYTQKQDEVVSAINNTINEISLAVNSSEVPIENAKYHIRGYFYWDVDDNSILNTYKEHIKGIKVQYRYKNKDQNTGNAISMSDGEFIFSDWNDMDSFNRMLTPSCDIDNQYSFSYEANNDRVNEPSFNQIDIPISQGETVDIRLKIVWDFGSPFIETTSAWSDILNIAFPEEYLKDIQILTIIEENNNDIETNRFNNILINTGTTKHISDMVVDQDLTYFHHPEHIASGFYTSERRVIPLKDKLMDMDTAIISIQDIISNANSEDLKVEFIFNSTSTQILPNQDNHADINIDLETAADFNFGTLQMTNISKHTINLYSLFPGNRSIGVKGSSAAVYDSKGEYSLDILINNKIGLSGVVGIAGSGETGMTINNLYKYSAQCRNQFIYFRSLDAYDGHELNNTITESRDEKVPILTAAVTNSISQIFIDSNNIRSYKVLSPGESLLIPICFRFPMTSAGTRKNNLELSFDLRTSLFTDPRNYAFSISYVDSSNSNIVKKIVESQTNVVKYNTVIAKIY